MGPRRFRGPEIFYACTTSIRCRDTYDCSGSDKCRAEGYAAESLRKKVRDRSPEVPLKFTTMEAALAEDVARRRVFRTLLFAAFAGLCGVSWQWRAFMGRVMAYVVGQRLKTRSV